jgi:hypothetical protein
MDNNVDNSLYDNVIKLLQDNGFDKIELLNELNRIYYNYKATLIKEFNADSQLFYRMKDIVWYNMEHLASGGQNGLSSMKYLGTKYPIFMRSFYSTQVVQNSDLQGLKLELESIIDNWSSDLIIADIETNGLSYHGGDNPTEVIIYSGKEHPSKYDKSLLSHTSIIVDGNGNNIKTGSVMKVLCHINGTVGEDLVGKILYNILIDYYNACKIAIEYGKDLLINFE